MLAAKGRTLLVLLALGLAVATAVPAAASIPRSGQPDRLDAAPPALLAAAAAAAEPELGSPAEPHRFALLEEPPGDRFELLDPASVEHVAFTGRPPQPHLFPELETRLGASPFGDLDLLEPIGFQLPDCLELASIGVGRSCQGSYFALNNPVGNSDPMGLILGDGAGPAGPLAQQSQEESERLQLPYAENEPFVLTRETYESCVDIVGDTSASMIANSLDFDSPLDAPPVATTLAIVWHGFGNLACAIGHFGPILSDQEVIGLTAGAALGMRAPGVRGPGFPISEEVARVPRGTTPRPSTGSLRNLSGNLDEAAHAARTQPYYEMPPEPTWRLGGFKSAQKWQNQMQARGWTPQQITEAVQGGQRYSAPNLVHPGNPATR